MVVEARPIPIHRTTAGVVSGLEAASAELRATGPSQLTEERLIAAGLGGGPDASARARRLLDGLGGVPGIARATVDELCRAGAPRRAALGLVVGAELCRRLADAWPDERWVVRAPADVAERLAPAMGPLEREELRVLLLDSKNAVHAMRTLYVGNLAGSSVRVGEVYRDAVRACAAAIVVVHNHPSGDPTPSGEDLRISAEIAQAGALLDIELLDHLIIGRARWVSLRALGTLGQPPATMR
jgi:DNA repair protein RadC